MRKNKMTIAILGCIGIFLITALILVPAAQAGEISQRRLESYLSIVKSIEENHS